MKGGAKIYVGPPFLRQRWGHGPVAPPLDPPLISEALVLKSSSSCLETIIQGTTFHDKSRSQYEYERMFNLEVRMQFCTF